MKRGMRVIVLLLVVFTCTRAQQLVGDGDGITCADGDKEQTEAFFRAVSAELNKGAVLYRSGDFKGAVEHFTTAAQIQPSSYLAHFNLGSAQLMLANFKEAAEQFQAAVSTNDNLAITWHLLGYADHKIGKAKEATQAYLKALQIDPTFSVSYNNLGQIYLDNQDLKAAETAFVNALSIAPDTIEALDGLCVTYALLGQTEQGLSVCGKAFALKPSLASTYYLGWCYLDLKRYTEALPLLQKSLELNPSVANIYVSMAQTLAHLGRFSEALKYNQKAIELDSRTASAYAGIGYVYYKLRKVKEARVNFEKAVTLAPDANAARYNLAVVCLQLKRKDCALEQYNVLKTIEPVLSTKLLDQIYSSKVVRLMN